MAKNVAITAGAGTAIAADEVTYNAVASKVQIIKLMLGADGAYDTLVDSGQQLSANSLPVVISSDQSAVPVSGSLTNISGTISLPTGASTAARQDTGNTSLGTLAGAIVAEDVASVDADPGIRVMAIRKATPANTSGTDGDNEQLQVSAGRLWVNGSGVTLTVDGSGVTQPVSYATTGSGTATGALRVELPTNGTGVIATVGAVTAITNALPAGTNAIGKLAANSGVDIGDVDVTSVPTDPFGANADAASATGSISAKLRFIAGTGIPITGTVTVGSHAVTNAGTFAVQAAEADGANVTLGAKADAKSTATDTTAITVMQVLKQISASVQAPPSQAVTNAGTFAVQSVAAGDVAHDAADSGNPVKVGAKAVSAEPTAVTANDRANLITDLVGKLIVLPYANPENFVSGVITTAMTGTTSTSLIAAPAAGLRNYITQITVSNAHATVGTDLIIQDGSGGTTLYTIPAAAVYGGSVITLPTPLRQPTTATAIFCANVTTGASTKVSASGYKGA